MVGGGGGWGAVEDRGSGASANADVSELEMRGLSSAQRDGSGSYNSCAAVLASVEDQNTQVQYGNRGGSTAGLFGDEWAGPSVDICRGTQETGSASVLSLFQRTLTFFAQKLSDYVGVPAMYTKADTAPHPTHPPPS